MSSQTVVKNKATNLKANSFTAPTGYTFDGWNTAADRTGTYYPSQSSITISSNLTLYARWYCNGYSTCTACNGSGTNSI